MDAPLTIEIGDCLLAQVAPGDTPALAALFAAPGMAAFLPPGGAGDPVAAMVAGDVAHWRAHGIGRWVIRREGEVVGMAGLTVKPPFQGLNLSYHLAPPARGQGIATAVAAHLARLPGVPGPVYALIVPPNPASAGVLRRAGFRLAEEVDYGGRRAERWLLPAPHGAN